MFNELSDRDSSAPVESAFFGAKRPLFLATPVNADNVADTPIDPYASTRYGPIGVLDHRSLYGAGVFPEPFLADDSDLEVNELQPLRAKMLASMQ